MPIHRLTLPLPLLALLLTTTPAFAGLTWEERSVSIEAKPEQAVIEAAFAFVNTGDDPVTITRVTTSCGCTTPSLDKRTYAPGETGAILARFEIGDRTGRHSSRIIVRSDAPGSSTTTLTLRSKIPELVRLPVRLVHWRPDEPREPKTLPLELVHEDALNISRVRSDSDLITTSLAVRQAASEDADADANRRYELTITPTGAPGRAEVLIDVAGPDASVHTVRLPARILPSSRATKTDEPVGASAQE